MDNQYSHEFFESNGIRMHAVTAGPADGPLVILLHGFPEFWYGWKNQIAPLAAAGFRVVAPDQRGYNLTDRPQGLDPYRLDNLAQDITGLIDALGRQRAHIVGHDWGGGVAWALAAFFPERVQKLAILNCPYPPVAISTSFTHPLQFLRSSYIAFFQLPVLPEALLRNNDWELPARGLRVSSRPGAFSAADLEQYRIAWWQPGAMTGMLNWYRALLRRPAPLPPKPRFQMPVLIQWGAKDPALGRHLAEASARLCADVRLIYFEEATHWVQHEEPAAINRNLIKFFNT